MTEQEENDALKELGLVVASNKEEEIWHRTTVNLKKVIDELEKELEELPAQIAVNRSLLEMAKSKAPKNAT